MSQLSIMLLSLVNGLFYYAFFYYLLYSIKNTVNLHYSALILLVLFSFALLTCPIVLHLIGFLSLANLFILVQ